MSFIEIREMNITDFDTDCVVNAANRELERGGGVCGAIFYAASGEELTAACRRIGGCPTGGAVITPGFRLKARYIVHAVGPIYCGGSHGEDKLLYSCYKESLMRAMENDCHSIAFPLISSGIFGYPLEGAWQEAISACRDFIATHPDYEIEIYFAILDRRIAELGRRMMEA